MPIKAPYLPYDKLREIAHNFLLQYHPSGTVPIPIAAIVEFQFGVDIVPIPGLHESLEIDSSISNDLLTIYVDDFVFRKRMARYRFSLAHELSHRLLHADIFRGLTFRNLGEFKAIITSIPPDQYGWIEWQAYSLAGLMLVPPDQLAAAYRRADQEAAAAGISLQNMDDDARGVVYSSLGLSFEVSRDVIRKRLKYDGIMPPATHR